MSTFVLRSAGRALSVPIIAIWGLFLIASLFGDAAVGSRPLVVQDYVGLAAVIASVAGLGIAWRWELAGAAVSLAGTLVGAFVNWRALIPGFLILVAACLFLAASLSQRVARADP
jgi:hypothetical protein